MKKMLAIFQTIVTLFGCVCFFSGCNGNSENGGAHSEPLNESQSESVSEEKDPPKVFDTEGKVLATFGDSITWYDGNAYTWGKEHGKIAVGYQHYMKQELGFSQIYNCGYSGFTMPQIIAQLKQPKYNVSFWKSLDYLTIMSGANDERHGTPLGEVKPKGSSFDENTYIGALQSGIEHALSKNSKLEIILFTPIKGWIYAPAGYGAGNPQTNDGVITAKWGNAVKEVAELYGFTVCDLYNESGIDYDTSDRVAYMNDPEPPANNLYSLHPNTEGYKLMAKAIINTFKGAM